MDYVIYSPHSGQAIGLNCYCYRRTFNPCNSSSCPDYNNTNYPYCKDVTTCMSCGSCFCDYCCFHVIVGQDLGYCCPLDISAAQDAWIYAYMSASIGSVKVVYPNIGVCRAATGDINTGTWLEAWTGANATGKRLGRLLYAHLKNRQHANGEIINKFGTQFPWYVSIGQVPSVPTGQQCYLSTHTHFSIWADTGVAKSRTGSYNCGANLSAGYTPIYWWTY